MSGRLIVIEGLDGSGKSTQMSLLRERLGESVRYIKFPDYDDPSSTLIKMYLDGQFGDTADSVNAYAASLLYSVDRFASFRRHWKNDYEGGKTILCDRYTTSNAVHQMSKLPRSEWKPFLDWLYDTEFCKIGIPRPDKVIFLDVPVEVSQKMMTSRYRGDEGKKDIHERDVAYLHHCYECALFAAEYLGWTVVKCTADGKMRSIEDIAAEVYSHAAAAIGE